MIDPLGRFFSNAGGRLRYSQPILEVGVADAFRQVSFDVDRFEARGGLYEWRNATIPLTISSRS
jgi:radical S-adenosyl methionine domain-containing protein 2